MVLDKIRTGLVASPWHNRQEARVASMQMELEKQKQATGRGQFAHNFHVSAVPACIVMHWDGIIFFRSAERLSLYHGLRRSSEPRRQRIMRLMVINRRNRLAYCNSTRC